VIERVLAFLQGLTERAVVRATEQYENSVMAAKNWEAAIVRLRKRWTQ
jgi:hypothetical protein